EWDILHPPPAWDTGSNALGLTLYTSEVPAGMIDGVNATFRLSRTPTTLQLYRTASFKLQARITPSAARLLPSSQASSQLLATPCLLGCTSQSNPRQFSF